MKNTEAREGRTADKMEWKWTHLDDVRGDRGVVAVAVLDVAFEIDVEVLEDEVEFLVNVHDVEEAVRLKSFALLSGASHEQPKIR
jgi:hypothetical protein